MKNALIIGGGFAGCSMAHQLELIGNWKVTLIEKNKYLGAGVRTHWYGGHPYTFGPRHFLTEYEEAYVYLNKIIPLRDINHRYVTYIESDQNFFDFPIHHDDIKIMPDKDKINEELSHITNAHNSKNLEEYWIKSVGETLYNKFIKKYNHKMWMVDDNKTLDTFEWSQKISLTKGKAVTSLKEQLPSTSLIKSGSREVYDGFSCYPIANNGYNDYFDIATKEANVLVHTNIDHFDIQQKTVSYNNQAKKFDIIINTISPDILFDECYGKLKYVGKDFHPIVLPIENCFPKNIMFLYFANEEKFTRIVEFKKFTMHNSKTTLLGLEIPSLNGNHYPLPTIAEYNKAQKYINEMPDGVFSIGRAGSFDYNTDMDDCIIQAMDVISYIN